MLKIDHVAIWSNNMMSTAWELHRAGLASYDGGYFQQGAVALRAVPLGNGQYIEIEQIVDELAAKLDEDQDLAQFALALREGVQRDGAKLFAFLVVTDDFEGHRKRVGAEAWDVPPRVKPDGSVIHTRGFPKSNDAIVQGLPPFCDLDSIEEHPASVAVPNPVEPQGIVWLEVGGDEARMNEWLGPEADTVPLRFVSSAPGVYAMGIAMADGDTIEIRPGGGSLGIRHLRASETVS